MVQLFLILALVVHGQLFSGIDDSLEIDGWEAEIADLKEEVALIKESKPVVDPLISNDGWEVDLGIETQSETSIDDPLLVFGDEVSTIEVPKLDVFKKKGTGRPTR